MSTLLSKWRDGSRLHASIENPALPLTASTLVDFLGGAKAHAGVSVNEKSALTMPAVWCAVNVIAGTAAALPLHAYRRVDDVRLPLEGGQAARLLESPHPDMTAYEFWETVYAHMLLWGNAYVLVLRNQDRAAVELWPIHPSRVKVGRATDGTKWYQFDGDREAPFSDTQIMHLPGFGYDGVCGVSPISLARQGIGLALAAEEYGARLFGSGSLASGILQTEQRLDRTQAEQLKAQWQAKAKGLANSHEVAVLDSGAKFQQLTIPPEDAQFIQVRGFQISEVARMFGLPPHMLMDTEKSTSWGTGIESQGIGFVVYTLRRWLTRVEQRVTRILRPSPVYAKYSVEGLLRGDSTQRAAFYKSLWDIGVFSTNDIRRLEDLPPVEGGDVRYRPLNMGELGVPDETVVPEPESAAPLRDSTEAVTRILSAISPTPVNLAVHEREHVTHIDVAPAPAPQVHLDAPVVNVAPPAVHVAPAQVNVALPPNPMAAMTRVKTVERNERGEIVRTVERAEDDSDG